MKIPLSYTPRSGICLGGRLLIGKLCQPSLPPARHKGSYFPTTLPHLSPPSSQICAALVDRNDSFVFIYTSLINLIIYLLALWVSFLVNCRCCPCSVCNYSHDTLLEVASEGVGLMVLDLSVLHGAAPQVVVQLCGVDGRTALLFLRGVLPDPEVDVLGQETAHSPGLGCGQRDQSGQGPASPLMLAPLAWQECHI